ncbi:MAG: Asp-tRNA(Asn)/Glu-tRNA(Gln) amidotransferase subunit GatC [Patescibacteria group bacterium]|nr:Asp-tRNA(Asn)/Glu-tRNA(Gln) amidotransferase subunit GatC [Patescibacteria group bacterium]
MIDEKDIKHVAALARLKLTGEEVKRFSGQLGSVFEYMKDLNEVDTEGVEPTSQVTGLSNVTEEDTVRNEYDADELLGATELPVERHQIKVKPVFE